MNTGLLGICPPPGYAAQVAPEGGTTVTETCPGGTLGKMMAPMPPSPAHSASGLMSGVGAGSTPPATDPQQPDAMAAMQAQIAALQEQLVAANNQAAATAANMPAGALAYIILSYTL